MVVWLVGLSGAGKTTIGRKLSEIIVKQGFPCVFLDGDIFRDLMGDGLGHTLEDRRINGTRIAKFCNYLNNQQINVVCGVLSLFEEQRVWNRQNIKNYYDVFIDVDFDDLVRNDDKGLYKQALNGQLKNVVGVDLEFKPAIDCALVLKNNFTIDPGNLAESIYEKVEDVLESAVQ